MSAHPVKAGILGLLCLVAMWFWTPLVWQWAGIGEQASASPTVEQTADDEPVATTPGMSEAVPKTDDPSETRPPWYQQAQWMADDPRTAPTDPLRGNRDPFLVPQIEVAAAVVEQPPEEIEQQPPPITPQDLGVVLSGTLIGPKSRVAQINGRPYRQGEAVRLLHDGETIEFVLAAVDSQRIWLQRDDEQYELRISGHTSSGRIEFLPQRD